MKDQEARMMNEKRDSDLKKVQGLYDRFLDKIGKLCDEADRELSNIKKGAS